MTRLTQSTWRSALFMTVPLALTSAAACTPFLARSGWVVTSAAAVFFFSPVCHQDPARSFWIFGAPVAVCARCLGVYLGAAVGVWLKLTRRAALTALLLAAAVNGIDWVFALSANHARFLLGAMVGVALAGLMARDVPAIPEHADRTLYSAR